MMKGLPCSGKTKWAKDWASQSHNRVRVSWSDILETMGSGFRHEKRLLAFDAALRIVKNAIRMDKDIVLDECNLYAPQFGLFVAAAQMNKCKVVWHTMKASPEECKINNKNLGGVVSDEMIDRLFEKYKAWLHQK